MASNRGPIEYLIKQDGSLKQRRGAGGMVTALIDAGSRMEVTWVAMAMTEGDRLAQKEAQQHDGLLQSPIRGQKMRIRYVAIAKNAYRKHYEVISNQVLWFLQHYLYDAAENSSAARRLQDAWTNGYVVANRAIADAVIAEISHDESGSHNSSAVVMLHDYHLYLASALIREAHPGVVMQQFIHIPWPDIRCWNFLPGNIAQAIFSGLVGNDIIGFQTERDARNFLEGARTMLDGAVVDFEDGTIWWKNREITVRAYPISISVSGERKVVNSTAGQRAAAKIRPLLGKQTIMRVDRVEPTKNIVRGFQAYKLLLENHPELRGNVTFLAFLVPSRQTLAKYKRYRCDILKIIEEINQDYGTEDWTPITAFWDNDRVRALAAMQFYDVLLVNPIIDGMNLVVKEGAVVNKTDGALVLSRTVGAFQQLGKAAIPTSPTDLEETAQALYTALTMPEGERHERARLACESVERHDLNRWLTRQVNDINELLDQRIASSTADTYRASDDLQPLALIAP